MHSWLVALALVALCATARAWAWTWKKAVGIAVIGLQLPLTAVGSVDLPSDIDNNLVRMAFKDFDEKRFDAAEAEFSLSINRWNEMHRPRDEIVSLLISRGNVYLDNKKFDLAIKDFNGAIDLMKIDGEKADGTANYPEYVSAFVDRGLVYEGLGKWSESLDDYNKAIKLWGGGRGENINPFVLNYRGNVLTRLNRFDEAILDYDASSKLFLDQRDIARYSEARSNYALALYQVGDTDAAVKAMKDIIRKNPGFADMRVALAAYNWSKGDYVSALKEWQFTCDRIDVGCKAYTDNDWVVTVRRWPDKLAKQLQQFLKREIPEKLLGDPGTALAPKSMK